MKHQTSITSFNALEPAMVRTIREAFDEAVKELELRRGAAPEDTQAFIAQQIVGLARRGVSELKQLRDAALSAVHA